MIDTAVELKNISKTFSVKQNKPDSLVHLFSNPFRASQKKIIKALSDINLEIKRGEIFGIIGRNGSGKSTLLRIISGVLKPDMGGHVFIKGSWIRVSLGLGFDKELTARENIYLNGSLLGLTFKEIGKNFHSIIEFAELEKFVDTKIKYFSSGMRSRLAFAVACNSKADIFLMDEYFGGVGDAAFQEKSIDVFKSNFLANSTVILVTHSTSIVTEYCDRALYLDQGKIVDIGNPKEVTSHYLEKVKNGKT
jgi:ABC-2 type transport system ATP-binding protein